MISPLEVGVIFSTVYPPFSASAKASAMLVFFPLLTSSTNNTWLTFLTTEVSDDTLAFSIKLLNVGINTATSISITAITITSSTIVNPLLFFLKKVIYLVKFREII